MNRVLRNKDVFQLLEELAPKQKAYNWDNVGLQIGSFDQPAKKIMVTLDVLESVVDEAIANDVDLIIAHHPLLFKPMKQINLQSPKGRTISKLIKNNITVYAAHTNLDMVEAGVNDMLANALFLENTKPLVKEGSEILYKLSVHVPETHQEKLKEVLGDAGAGMQGDYSHCSFQIEGTGSFRPMKGAAPFIGEVGKPTEVDEVKLEAMVSDSILHEVVHQVIKAHPYEEPAIDIIKLENEGETYGLGRIGKASKVHTLEEYVSEVKEKLNLNAVRVTGHLDKEIKNVAILGGSGEKYINEAKRAGADVYITGDITFHSAQNALESGLAVIDAGHYIEEIMKEQIKLYLQEKLEETTVIVSETVTDPFQYM